MLELPDTGLYRKSTEPMPGNEQAFPADVLVYLGKPSNGGVKFLRGRAGANGGESAEDGGKGEG